jgi:predicted ATPase/serine phosphatase RsbU (regulator of sigma subunit)
MLVAGYAGIGKSALIQEIYKSITEKRGFFIAGKFNQFQRNTPYSAIVMAFQDLVQQLISKDKAQFAQWKEKILAAVGTNGQVIAQVIPEIETIIGTQPPLPALSPTATQNRFNHVFQNFIQLFCQPEHPLVIFLDDLQWADSASLQLMTLMMAQSQYLFLIGAYRDNEVDATHPLMLTLSKISVDIKTLTIAPLSLPHINQLIADALGNTLEESRELAELVQRKTGGNPFFMGEFLKTLYIEELLNFDFQQGKWQWDLAQIKARNITDNVVELMTDKVHKLSEKTQQVLKLAACIGNQFEIETLAIVSEKDAQETKADLWEALADGFIFPLEKAYKFAHDRVQQAVYSLIPKEEKQVVHWQIGQLLLKNTPPEHREQRVFVIVDQLNAGIELIEPQSEREELAHLNRLAGEKARASAAYQPAWDYFSVGLGLLSDNCWQTQYDLALALHVEAAEAAYLSGQFEQMEQLLEVVLQQAKTLLDKVKAYEIKILSHISQQRMLDAIETALPVLAQLGVSLPKKPKKWHIILGLLQTKITLVGKRTEDLINLPEMTDSAKLAAMRILSRIISASYIAMPELLPLVVFKKVNLSLKYGNTSLSAYAYATYGMILCGSVGDIEAGYQFGQLALTVLERFEAKELKAKVLQMVNNFIIHWKEHTQETLKPLLMAYQSGVESGDLEYAAYAVVNHPINSYVIGQELAIIDREITAKYSGDVARQIQGALSYVPGIYGQLLLNLMGQSDDPSCFSGERYDEHKMLPLYLKSNNINALGYLYCNKLTLCYLFQAYHQALESAVQAEKYLDGLVGQVLVPLFHFYDSLARLAVFQDAQKPEQKRILKKVAANQKKMKKWAHHAPMNHLHKFYLVDAERARVLGKDEEARDSYDKAIALAHSNEYLNEEALANELASQFYLARGLIRLANHYLREAHQAYSRWGAVAKAKDLEIRYPQLKSVDKMAYVPSHTLTMTANGGEAASSVLDFASVLKASQTIAGEIELARLLENLMKIVIENAGAQRGCLILEKNRQWVIEAEGTDNKVTVLQSQAIDPSKYSSLVPTSLINYVTRAKKSVVLHDAILEGQFTHDQYLIENQMKSALCAPLLNQGQLMGILYLENRMTTGAFTSARLEVLRVLSSQAAVSLENALLYRTLEQKVEERTAQLAKANQEITLLNEQLKSENLRMGAELDVSRQLQQMLLPTKEELEQIYGLEIAGFMKPANEVGGDYYDVLKHDGRILIAIGDATGHGLESGVLAIMVQTAVRTLLANNETDPVKFLTAINKTIYENVRRMNSDKNMTLTLLDYKAGQLTLSGQHEEMIVVRNGKVERIDTLNLGFPIGFIEDIAHTVNQTTVQLNPGDVAVLYTDGITEARNMEEEEYGLERLCEIVKLNWQKLAEDIRQAVIDNVRQYIGQQKVFDDITLLVLKQK